MAHLSYWRLWLDKVDEFHVIVNVENESAEKVSVADKLPDVILEAVSPAGSTKCHMVTYTFNPLTMTFKVDIINNKEETYLLASCESMSKMLSCRSSSFTNKLPPFSTLYRLVGSILIKEEIHLLKEKGLTGAVLWDSGIIISKWIQSSISMSNKNVLELGSGTGIGGISTAMKGAASVLLTDLEAVLPTIRSNVRLSQAKNISVKELKWGKSNFPSEFRSSCFDLVIGADLIYNEQASFELIETINEIGASMVFIVHRNRAAWECHFFHMMDVFYSCTKVTNSVIDVPPNVELFEFQKKEIPGTLSCPYCLAFIQNTTHVSEKKTLKSYIYVDEVLHHTDEVLCAGWSENGLLATGGCDESIFLYQADTSLPPCELKGHKESVAHLDFSLDYLITGDMNGVVFVWKHNGDKVLIVKPKSKYSGGVGLLCWISSSRFVVGYENGELTVFEMNLKKIVKRIPGKNAAVSCGKNVGNDLFAVGFEDGSISLFDMTFSFLASISMSDAGITAFDLRRIENDMYLVAGSQDKVISLVVLSGNEISVKERMQYRGHATGVEDVVFIDDTSFASCSMDGKIIFFNIRSTSIQKFVSHPDGLLKLYFDGSTLLSASLDGCVREYSTTGEKIAEYKCLASAILAFAVSKGKFAVAGETCCTKIFRRL